MIGLCVVFGLDLGLGGLERECDAEGGLEDVCFGQGFFPLGLWGGICDNPGSGEVGEGGVFEGVWCGWGGGALDVKGSDVDGGVERAVWVEGDCGAAVWGSWLVVWECGFEFLDDLHGADFGCACD